MLMVQPQNLNPLPDGDLKLSDLVETTRDNYVIYHTVKIQLEQLQEWIKLQRNLYKGKNND